MHFKFAKLVGESAVSSFMDIALWSGDFPFMIKRLLEGENVTIAGSSCDYYKPEELNPWDDFTPYEGVKFRAMSFDEDIHPAVFMDVKDLYDLIKTACKFYAEDQGQSSESLELLDLVKKKASSA